MAYNLTLNARRNISIELYRKFGNYLSLNLTPKTTWQDIITGHVSEEVTKTKQQQQLYSLRRKYQIGELASR